ncbi:MAG TPA: zinc ribbon domain-containing protein [Anaerolineales bacterium]|nr:zinc ribbon domain-containing protein [Anaerolineales bacterium]
MATRRTLGYIQNEWTCPNCNTRNKGSLKTCANCGAPQPENVQFELPSEQKFVTDQASVQAAQAGADIHCGFCGTRNAATAKTCSQCGADLTEGKARTAGRVMQAPPVSQQPKIIKCDNCGTENPGSNSLCSNCGSPLPKLVAAPALAAQPVMGTNIEKPAARKKTNWLLIGGIFACLAAVCIGAAVLFLVPTKATEATVMNVHWQTSVPLQEIKAVEHSNESGNPPSDAYDVSCHDESKNVCEQKTVDKGNGYSEVVEECHTQTQQYCSYTVDEWTTIQTYTLDGNNLQPIYDSPNISTDQRIGDKSEELTVSFSTNKGEKTYHPGTISEFQQFSVGSTWTLKMNALGGVVSVEP